MSQENRGYSDYTVLFVDDEVDILSSLRRGLIDQEYHTEFATSGEKALDILSKKNIGVIVCDMKMPGMDGLTLLKEVRKRYPKTVRIVLSGYAQLQQVIATVNQADIFKFITKPWKLEDEFTLIIKQALDYHILQLERDEFEKALIRKNEAYQKILKSIEDIIENSKENKALIVAVANEIISNAKTAAVEGLGYMELRNKLVAGLVVFNEISSAGYARNNDQQVREIIKYMEELSEKQENINSLKIDSKIKDSHTFMTGIQLIQTIIRLSINTFTANIEKNIIQIIIGEEKSFSGNGFSISVLIMNKSDSNTTGSREIKEKNIDSLVDLYNKVFDKVMKMYSGAYSCARVDLNIVFKLEIGK